MTNEQSQVVQNEAGSRFEYLSEAGNGSLKYRREPERIVFVHTEVAESLRGQGIGGMLAQAGLEYARAQNLRVVAQCPFVRQYIADHGEYQDLVDA